MESQPQNLELLGSLVPPPQNELISTCLWECVHSCPSVRLPAVTYLLAHYKKKKSMEDQLYMIGLNINLMVCCTSKPCCTQNGIILGESYQEYS